MFSPDFHQFVESLSEAKAEYLIVGGYAVGFYGHPRYTGDLDIWINPSVENAHKVLKAIDIFGFSSLGISLEDLTKPQSIIQMGNPPLRIDLLTDIDGVSFANCYDRRKRLKIAGLEFNFISFSDLVANKKESGRAKDLEDIRNMRPEGGEE